MIPNHMISERLSSHFRNRFVITECRRSIISYFLAVCPFEVNHEDKQIIFLSVVLNMIQPDFKLTQIQSSKGSTSPMSVTCKIRTGQVKFQDRKPDWACKIVESKL